MSPMVTVGKLTELDRDQYIYEIYLFLLYNDVWFVMKNTAVMKILDFQNDDTWQSPIHHKLFCIYLNNH